MNKQQKRQLGFALMALGFLAAAFFTVQHPTKVIWSSWIAAATVTTIGAVLLRLSNKIGADEVAEMASNITVIDHSLATLVERVARLNAEKNEDNVFDYCTRIDDECMEPINTFVEAREAMIHRFGLPTYAKLMDNFALAERSLNRAWCASADGYIDELHTCIERADNFMRAAHEVVQTAMANDVQAGQDAPPNSGSRPKSS